MFESECIVFIEFYRSSSFSETKYLFGLDLIDFLSILYLGLEFNKSFSVSLNTMGQYYSKFPPNSNQINLKSNKT